MEHQGWIIVAVLAVMLLSPALCLECMEGYSPKVVAIKGEGITEGYMVAITPDLKKQTKKAMKLAEETTISITGENNAAIKVDKICVDTKGVRNIAIEYEDAPENCIPEQGCSGSPISTESKGVFAKKWARDNCFLPSSSNMLSRFDLKFTPKKKKAQLRNLKVVFCDKDMM